jgi:hypothetical protein
MREKVVGWLRRLAPQYRLPQAALLGAPYLAQRFGQPTFVWPPLGSLEAYAVPGATVAIGLCLLLPTLIENQKQARSWLKRSLGAAGVALMLFSVLVARYVITVDTPNDGKQTRSIGFRVEPRIRAQFPDNTDPELLRIGGLEDWQIQKVWTPDSVLALRLCLLGAFSLFFGSSNVALGAAERANRRRVAQV